MALFHIKKGKDIQLKGQATKEVVELPLPKQVAVQPHDFKGLKPRLAVKLDDRVKVGSTVLTDKAIPELRVCSPASGKVVAINRGNKRALLEIVIETDGQQETENFKKFDKNQIQNLSKSDIVKNLLEGGLWPAIRQRPFSKIANPEESPKSIFIHATSTEPLAADVDFILNGKEAQFQQGLDLVRKLTEGDIHLCTRQGATSQALTQSQGVSIHQFSGPHPTGNVGTHIHYVDPLHKGDLIWFVEAQDVLRIADLFSGGVYPVERIVAITGEGAQKRNYVKTIIGAPFEEMFNIVDLLGMRCISGSVLAGQDVGPKGFLRFYDSQVTIIPKGGKRELIGWLYPGFNKYTFSKTFASAFMKEKEFSLDTDEHGGHRTIVLNHIYDSLNALDIYTFFLLKAVLSGDIEEAEKLGILECDEEDFALCTFACPSKTDVGGIIQKGLELIEKEG